MIGTGLVRGLLQQLQHHRRLLGHRTEILTVQHARVALADLRCGIDRLLVTVGNELQRDARDGGAYVFRSRVGTWIKALCVDAQGVWLATRRLHEGRFHWPLAAAMNVNLNTPTGTKLF